MTDITTAGTGKLGGRTVHRLGYGAMQLAGPGVFGPPKDRGEAVAVLREAVSTGVDHIDTSDFYGPHVHQWDHPRGSQSVSDDLIVVTRSARVAARTARGTRHSPPRT